MKINPFVYGVLVLTVFLGIIFSFQAASVWSTSGKVTGSGERIKASAEDVNTIKGWMTIGEVSATFNVPLADMISAFNLPADTPASTALKDLESDTFDIPALRAWLQERQSKP